ncbi:MAG: anthranilate phosphoribosyltransferase [Solirubrobacteraceae bacterium]|nr:anthranilate phosphoribosyltransferase [Solirubrobacteraceae bacterium]
MSLQERPENRLATLPERAGRSGYEGFRAVIKAVGTGPRGSRALTFDEAHAATAALLAGEVSPVQAGAFLIAMRIKGETPSELAGITQALRDAARSVAPEMPASTRPVVACAGAFDGMAEGPHLSLAAAVLAAAAGARIVVHCGSRLGPKRGITAADVLAALGGPARPEPAESLEMLERADVALVHAGAAIPGWDALAEVRDEIGLRGPLHTAEKLVDHLGATRFVVGHTHSCYRERIVDALTLLGAQHAIAVRGIEGSDVLRPGRPSAADADGPLDLPMAPGAVLRGDADPDVCADLTRAIASGDEHGLAALAATLSAGVRLYAAGCCNSASAGADLAAAAIADGRATATLAALLAR